MSQITRQTKGNRQLIFVY